MRSASSLRGAWHPLAYRSSLLLIALSLACGAESSARPGESAGRRSVPARKAEGTLPPAATATSFKAHTGALGPPFRRPLPGPLPLPLAVITDAVPISVERVGLGGHWLVACAARADTDKNGRIAVEIGAGGTLAGDALGVELVVGGRKPEPIDDLLAYDPTGRFVAVRRAGKGVLLDLFMASELDLTTLEWDDRDDTLPFRAHRALAFDPRGEILAYVRRRGTRFDVVLRALEAGSERAVVDLPGEPHRLSWDGTGEQLVVSTVADDTSGNGRLEWPAPLSKGPRLVCSGPVPRMRATPEVGDRASTFVVPRSGGAARFVPDFAVPFGASVVVRAADGALLVAGASGRQPLTTATCGARILHADPRRGLVLVACPGKNAQRAAVELVGVGYRLELGVEIQPTSIDAWPDRPTRLLPLYPGSDALLVDLDRKATLRLDPGDQVVATSGSRALIRRRGAVVLFDAEKNTTKTLIQKLGPLPFVLVQNHLAVVGSEVVDVLRDDPLGSISGRALALTPSGEVLVARGGPPSAERLALGPLVWEQPPPKFVGGAPTPPPSPMIR